MSFLNPFALRKHIALLLTGFMPLIFTLFFLASGYSFLTSVFVGLGVIFVFWFVGLKVLSHPFRDMLEGKGILVLTIDSTGVIEPYLAQTDGERIVLFRKKKEPLETIYNRAITHYITEPQEVKYDGEKITVELPKEPKYLYALKGSSRLVFLYNRATGQFIAKDFLSDQEKDLTINHIVLDLDKKLSETVKHIRDFGRYVIENLRPKPSLFSSGWFWLVVIAVLAILGFLILQNYIGNVQNVVQTSVASSKAVNVVK